MSITVAARPHAHRLRPTLLQPTDVERERDLIERARVGDRDAFGALVRGHLPAAIRLAMQIMRNAADAEDVVQDACLSALKNLDEFQPGKPFWPWLSRIIVNRGLDLIDARVVRSSEPLSPELAASDPSPLRSAERDELSTHVRRVVDAMPPRQRLIVELFDLQGASVAEIAELTGSAPATVRWHLHVGRRALRTALSPLYGNDA